MKSNFTRLGLAALLALSGCAVVVQKPAYLPARVDIHAPGYAPAYPPYQATSAAFTYAPDDHEQAYTPDTEDGR